MAASFRDFRSPQWGACHVENVKGITVCAYRVITWNLGEPRNWLLSYFLPFSHQCKPEMTVQTGRTCPGKSEATGHRSGCACKGLNQLPPQTLPENDQSGKGLIFPLFIRVQSHINLLYTFFPPLYRLFQIFPECLGSNGHTTLFAPQFNPWEFCSVTDITEVKKIFFLIICSWDNTGFSEHRGISSLNKYLLIIHCVLGTRLGVDS